MTKEKFKHYMELFENLEKVKNGLNGGMEIEDYQLYCTIILEKLHQEYVKGDSLDSCY